MTVMDWFTAITSLLAIPSSCYALYLIWKDFFSEHTPAAVPIEPALAPLRNTDKVLLEVDAARAKIPGTFENTIYKFLQACPEPGSVARFFTGGEERKLFIKHPVGVYRVSANQYRLLVMLGLLCLLIGFIFLTLGLLVGGSWWLFAGVSAFFVSVAYLCFRWSQYFKKVRDAALAYVNYLKDHEILIDLEFTQSKRMHEMRGIRN
jgi:hypothetical protein